MVALLFTLKESLQSPRHLAIVLQNLAVVDSKMFDYLSRKRNGEMTIRQEALVPRNVLTGHKNTPTEMTPCTRVDF